ncbi:hypothetical protein BDZ97DRAFT_1905388 [Flammula alnicola]|nr:hypothetical protein BDZ97DRAFT_1905388 [Flammula alnicola]
MFFYIIHASLFALCGFSYAQNLSVDPNWREPSTSRALSQRISIAQNAINAIIPQLQPTTGQFAGIGYWQAGNVWSAMAIQDQFTGTGTNKAAVVKNLNLVFGLYLNYDQFGQITQAQAQAGTHPLKNFPLAGTCDGVTMAGGVFWRPTPDDTSVNSITTGANWIRAHNLNTNDIVLDTVSGADCTRSPASWLFTYNSGKFIEGLSVLADVTADNQWNALMLSIIAAAVKNTSWQGSNGIITEGSDNTQNNDGIGFKAIFIRGLREAFRRIPENAQLRTLIRAYIDVQYNALLELAANGSSYSANWSGPTPTSFTSWGQLAALDVLTAAVEVN